MGQPNQKGEKQHDLNRNLVLNLYGQEEFKSFPLGFSIRETGNRRIPPHRPQEIKSRTVGHRFANANWNDLIIDDQNEPRPFIVTTADEENALYALDWTEGRIEAEELWRVRATDWEEAIRRVLSYLKANVLCVDAFDAAELRGRWRGRPKCSRLSEEQPLVKILTPWCAEVALAGLNSRRWL